MKKERRHLEQYQDQMSRLFPELHNRDTDSVMKTLSRPVTFQVTDDCNLSCFIAGTKILMGDFTYKNIEDVQVGDVVMSFPEQTEKNKQLSLEPTKVVHTFVRHGFTRTITTTDGESVTCTDEHPFLNGQKDWIRAEKIHAGEHELIKFDDANCFDVIPFKYEKVQAVETIGEYSTVYNFETETHTYIANNFAVHNCQYCYQINKGTRKMSLDTAKKFVDLLLDATPENNAYINPAISPFLIIDFIGGEPLLEVELMDQIMDYFLTQAIERQHPWADKYSISITTNGTLYFEPQVQKFLLKHRNHLSFSVTIDGNKELHDKCRVFPDGRPSYDLAVAAAQDWMKTHKGYMGSKITIAPENVVYLYDALVHMVDLGYEEINANCVYEKGWELEHATELYNQMKRFADYLLENDKDYIFCSLFEEIFFRPMDENDNDNWCWGKGTPILTSTGYKPIEDIKIGDLVYTEDGTLHPVINTMSHFADNCVEISASGTFSLICTDNHKLFVKPFDYRGWKGKKHYKPCSIHEIKDIHHKDLVRLFQLPEGNIDYDLDLAYLIGRYIGDGWDYENGRGKGICCAFNQREELEEKFRKANVDFHSYSGNTVQQYTIARDSDNPNNVELLRILPDCGHLATGKHLPSECFSWTPAALKALLNGYMDADGNLNKKGQYRFNTVSYRLAQEFMIILRTLGYTPTCYKNERKGESTILGRTVTIQDRYEVYFYKDSNRSKYVYTLEGDMWTYGLKSSPAKLQTVYNITVDTNHSYIAGGIVSSNCGGTGVMLSCDPDGYLYPCIRYMESSLGEDQPPIRIGHVDTGLVTTKEELETVKCLQCITRRSQSTDECFDCPIAKGCSWCSAYNYQEFGTVDKRATYICEMHKARALANVYYWNKVYAKDGVDKKFEMHCPKEWAVPIIGEQEYSYLLELSGGNEDEN